jgi:hypothetical protein
VTRDSSATRSEFIVKFTQRRTLVSLASTAVLTAGVGAGVSMNASAASDVHTLKFVAISGPSTNPTPSTFLSAEVEKSHGKVVGFDTISGRFNLKTHSIKIFVALSRKGGLLYATLRSTTGTTYHGRVTGGAGAYRGAEGTVTAHSTSQNSNRTYVTVRYHL